VEVRSPRFELYMVRVHGENLEAHRSAKLSIGFRTALVLEHDRQKAILHHRPCIVVKLDGLRRDVADFFSLPFPRAVWEKSKVL